MGRPEVMSHRAATGPTEVEHVLFMVVVGKHVFIFASCGWVVEIQATKTAKL